MDYKGRFDEFLDRGPDRPTLFMTVPAASLIVTLTTYGLVWHEPSPALPPEDHIEAHNTSTASLGPQFVTFANRRM